MTLGVRSVILESSSELSSEDDEESSELSEDEFSIPESSSSSSIPSACFSALLGGILRCAAAVAWAVTGVGVVIVESPVAREVMNCGMGTLGSKEPDTSDEEMGRPAKLRGELRPFNRNSTDAA